MPYETINDVDIYYEIHGPDDAPPLVLIEGWGYSCWMWFRQIPNFKEKYRCIVFDNRGVGRSSKPDFPYTMEMFASDTIGLLDALGIENAHILGISMGGVIAQQIAISYPDRVRSLLLVSTTFSGPNSIPAEQETQAMMFASPTETLSNEQAMEMRYSVALSPKFLQENKSFLKQITQWRDQYPQPLYAKGHQAAATLGFNGEEDIKQIKSKTLVLHGDSDLLVPPKNGEMIAERIATSKLVFVKDGHHLMFIENYEVFNSEILNFLDEVEK